MKSFSLVDYWNFPMNHRCKHMARYLEQRFGNMDYVGFEPFYSGSGPAAASPWYKARRGISNLVRHRIRVSTRNHVREIVIRDLYAPRTVHLLLDDLWRYLTLRPNLMPTYDMAIFAGPANALLIWLLKQSGKIKKVVYDDHDYFPSKEQGLSRLLIRKRECFCVRQADGVISANTLLAHLRRQQGARDVLVVPNGVDLSLFALARQKTPHPPTLVYMGALSPIWGVDLAIKAMPELCKSSLNSAF